MAPVQHYVPRFPLRNFCAGEKPKIWAFDKNTGKSFETNVRNVAGERDFYDLSVGDATLSLEEGLSKLEDAGRYRHRRNHRCAQSRRAVRRPCASCRIRLDADAARPEPTAKHAGDEPRTPSRAESALRHRGCRLSRVDGEEAKAMTMKSLTKPQKFAEHILNKAWLMFGPHPRIRSSLPTVS